jgi:lipopolysaccharide export system permease protein
MIFLILQFLWKYVDDLMGKGLDWTIIIELLFYASANLVPMALPLAILLSSIMTFGNLGESSELTAMKSAGLSLMRIMRPLTYFIILIAIGAFLFFNYVWPVANLKFRALIVDIQQQKPTMTITEKSFYNNIPGFSIRVMEKSKDGEEMSDILIYDHSNMNVTYKRDVWAEKGHIEQINQGNAMIFHLENGKIYEEVHPSVMKGGTYPFQTLHFKKAGLFFDLSEFKLQRTDMEVYSNHYELMNMAQLSVMEDSLRNTLLGKRADLAKNFMMRFLTYRYHSDSISTPKDTVLQAETAIDTTPKPLALNKPGLMLSTPDTASKAKFLVFQPGVPFQKRDLNEKRRLASNALNQARNSASFVTNLREEFRGREEFIQRHRLEWHRKMTLSVACIILFFIGAPLGAIIRKGGLGAPIVASTLLFIFYYILSIVGEKMAKSGAIDPAWGMWMSSIILFPVGFFLTWKSNNDSKLFDRDFYLRLFRIKRLRKA